MLYRDYARQPGEWLPNKFGGKENLEAIALLQRFNEEVYKNFPAVQTIAEESTSWPLVSRPTYVGGLGFGLKWNMGWMHDTLEYASKSPIHRKFHHDLLTFSLIYAFNENFVLPLSHDEVVHCKSSLLSKMPGDMWQKFANLRTLYGYMWGHPGKKLLFMGGEFGQWTEWDPDKSLDWHITEYEHHKGLQKFISDLNKLLVSEPALHQIGAAVKIPHRSSGCGFLPGSLKQRFQVLLGQRHGEYGWSKFGSGTISRQTVFNRNYAAAAKRPGI